MEKEMSFEEKIFVGVARKGNVAQREMSIWIFISKKTQLNQFM
jgi:hypothetical protein